VSERPSFTFVHCGDLHLDSPFEGIHAAAPEIAGVLRDATFQAFDRVIDLALAEGADFLVVTGDVYDGEDRSLRAQLRFREALRKAAGAGITCLVAHGNHDPLSGWEAKLALPDLVCRFGGQQVERFEVRRGGATLAQVYGLSYPVREMRGNLASGFRREPGGPFAIGVLHCNVGGDPNHDNYAPCTLEDLLAGGMDYWALGHIHARRILREREPCVIYPGNTQGRNWRELGPRGCYLVRVDGPGRVSPEFVPTDVVRWFSREVDIGGLEDWDALLDALFSAREEVRTEADGRAAILRVHLTGRGELHRELVRRIDLERDLGVPLREEERGRPDFVWVESLHRRTRPPVDLAQRRQIQDFVGDLLQAGEQLRRQDHPAARLREILQQRPEHRVIAGHLDALSEDDWLALLGDAEILGLDQLLPEDV
jgi:exonuclease SbcD